MTERATTDQDMKDGQPIPQPAGGWDLWEGQSIDGEFAVRQYLGGSDHSAVYLTELKGPNAQKAAIKFLRAGIASEKQLAAWKSAMELSHPGLLKIYKAGRARLHDTDYVYVVTEYAEENLSQILPQRVLTAAEARDMLAPTLDVLSFLHGKGLAVGRLKPSNILADHEQLKLASDSVRRDGETSDLFNEKLTPYDAPENSSGTTSIAGDIWALGITLCEVLTGKAPAVSGAAGVQLLPKNVPAEFASVISNCLERDPQRRWTAAEIGAGLRRSPAASQNLETERVAGNGNSHRDPQSGGLPAHGLTRSMLLPGLILALLAATLLGYWLFHHRGDGNLQQTAVTEPTKPVETARVEKSGLQQPPPAVADSSIREAPSAKPHRTTLADSPAVPAKVTMRETAPASGEIVHQVLPVVPQSAKNTIEGKIRVNVRVNVDSAGNVIGSHLDRSGPSKYFARLATEAAQEWKFNPQSGAREWMLHFRFSRAGVAVDPTALNQ